MAVRSLVRAPAFSAIVVLTLALAIGANTAVFSVLDVVMLRPLPYSDPDALVDVRLTTEPGEGDPSSALPLDALDALRAEPTLFREIAGWSAWRPTLTGAGEAAVVPAAAVTEGLLVRVLGVQPTLGRSFAPEEHFPDGARTAVLAHAFWRDRLGADPAVLGRALVLDDIPYTVVGVLPERFRPPFAGPIAVWTSAHLGVPCNSRCPTVHAIGRLEAGVSVPVAGERARAVLRVLEETRPDEYAGAELDVVRLRDDLFGGATRVLGMLLGAVALVLLVACTNVATLQLVRGEGRRTELVVRQALGAGRAAIVRQLLVESGVLAVAGGAVGLALAAWSTGALVALAPPEIFGLDGVAIDGRALGFTALVALGTGVLFGLAPAFRMGRGSLESAPRRGRVQRSPRRPWIAGLVVGQIALAVVLLVGAGLLLRSLSELHATDLGFDPNGVLAVSLELPYERFTGPAGRRAFYESLLERLADEPTVVSVGATSALPMTDAERGVYVAVAGEEEAEERRPDGGVAFLRTVTPGYFYTLGQRVLDGRAFDAADDASAPRVAVVNEQLARTLFGFPRFAAVGRRLTIDPAGSGSPVTVVGVVEGARHRDVREPPAPALYLPFAQAPGTAMTVLIRADGDPMGVADAARDAVQALDGSLAALAVERLSDVVDETLRADRFATRLLTMFAWVALFIAAVGLYGVLSHGTARRLRELGIRVALGAPPDDVRHLALRVGLGLAGAGIVTGLLASMLVTRLLESMLYGVSPLDPMTLATTGVVLGAAAFAASWAPARRAGGVDPVSVLGEE